MSVYRRIELDKTGGMYVIDIEECADCEQLIFPGEEVYETPAGDVCMTCGTLSEKVDILSY